MLNKYFTLLTVLVAFVLASCSESPTVPNAAKMDMTTINTSAGYAWFPGEMSSYTPDTIIKNVPKLYNPSVNRFVLFVRPSCSCPGTHKYFPQFYRILKDCGVTDANIEAYSMSDKSDKQPYDTLMIVNVLPTFIVMKNGKPVYSVTDTISKNLRDSTYPYTFETALIEGLKK